MPTGSSVVRRMITHPATGKRLRRVQVKGKGWYGWNTAYHVYNHVTTYEQLLTTDVPNIEYDPV